MAALDPCASLLLGAEMELIELRGVGPEQIRTWGGLRWGRSVVLEGVWRRWSDVEVGALDATGRGLGED